MDDLLSRQGPCSGCTEGLVGSVVLEVLEVETSEPRTPGPIAVVGRQCRAGVHIAPHCSCIAECRAIAAEGGSLPKMSWLRMDTVPVWIADLVGRVRCSSSTLDSMPGSGRRSSWT